MSTGKMTVAIVCCGATAYLYYGTALAETATWKAQAKGCTQRFAHAAVWDPKHENMIVYAGEGHKGDSFFLYDDLWTYAPGKDQWKELKLKDKKAPSRRAYHAFTWDTKRNQMWVFGGADGQFKGLDDLWSFDPETLQWMKAEPISSVTPKGRLSATLQYYPEKDWLVLVGGLNAFGKDSVPVRDLGIYDIGTKKWTIRKCAAPQLWQCASALDPKRGLLILHGGFDDEFHVHTETWIYDVAKDKWLEPIEGKRFIDAHTGVWDSVHEKMIIFGGANPEKDAKGYSDAWSFDPEKLAWSEVEVKGDKPAGRAYHSAVWVPKTRSMIIFGGTENQFSDPPRENQVWTLRIPEK